MDTKGICEIIVTYTLIFKITNKIEKKPKKTLKLLFLKIFGGLLTPLDQFKYFQHYDIRDQRQILLEKIVIR